ncbi:MAG: response regulator [Oscillatoria sp. PMC 1051.18]|nr:response regulator [Oscillatoria sp. PMC 1050.18]MEC5029749.1 response regulator [Oscillatoria sp. PMC 1051.18]
MTIAESPTCKKFCSQLTACANKQYTGRLDIENQTKQKWSLYLSFGRLAWATGGVHPVRRWRRQLARCCPQKKVNNISLRHTDEFECWDYHLMMLWVKREEIDQRSLIAVIRGIVTEVLFDIFQSIEVSPENGDSESGDRHFNSLPNILPGEVTAATFQIKIQAGVRPSNTGILPPSWMLEVESALTLVQNAWEKWSLMGLNNCYPNLAPTIDKPEILQKQVSNKVYANLTTAIDGKRTLRDLASILKQDLRTLTLSLLPYLRSGAIGLATIPDLPRPKFILPETPQIVSSTSNSPLVACVDDSPAVCQIMGKILRQAGYRFLALNDPVQALPNILKHKPDAIFLDLVMPVANGYEICTQIRRVGSFQEVPIIIITGQDGIIDRVRSKLVGASSFISKPIDPHKILTALENFEIKPL